MGFSFPIHGGNAPSPQPRGLLWVSNHKLQVCSLLWHSEGLWFNPSCPISPSGEVPLPLSPCRREELPQPPHPTGSQSPFSPLLLPPGSPRSPPHHPQLSSPSTRAVPAPPPSCPLCPSLPTLTACPSSCRATFILAIPPSSAPRPARAGPPPPPQRRLPPPWPGTGTGNRSGSWSGAGQGWMEPPQREGAGVWGSAGCGPLAPRGGDGWDRRPQGWLERGHRSARPRRRGDREGQRPPRARAEPRHRYRTGLGCGHSDAHGGTGTGFITGDTHSRTAAVPHGTAAHTVSRTVSRTATAAHGSSGSGSAARVGKAVHPGYATPGFQRAGGCTGGHSAARLCVCHARPAAVPRVSLLGGQ